MFAKTKFKIRLNVVPSMLLVGVIVMILMDLTFCYKDLKSGRSRTFYAESFLPALNRMPIKNGVLISGRAVEVKMTARNFKEAIYLSSLTNRRLSEVTIVFILFLAAILFWMLPEKGAITIFNDRFIKGLKFIGIIVVTFLILGDHLQESTDDFFIKSLTGGSCNVVHASQAQPFSVIIPVVFALLYQLKQSVTRAQSIEKEQELTV